jgi:hypothetical protein
MSSKRHKPASPQTPGPQPPPDPPTSAPPSLTVGVLVESLKPSEARSLIATAVTIIVMVFGAGVWVTSIKNELDNKAHVLRDQIEQAADGEAHLEFQKKIHDLEDKVRNLTIKNEELEIQKSASERRNANAPKLPPPPKTPSHVFMPPKGDR